MKMLLIATLLFSMNSFAKDKTGEGLCVAALIEKNQDSYDAVMRSYCSQLSVNNED